MVLDFNNEHLDFENIDLLKLNVTTIYNNIAKFEKFAKDKVINKSFGRFMNSALVQTALASDDTNDVDSLYLVFNIAIADNALDVPLAPMSKREFVRNLKECGYILKRTKRSVNGARIDITRVINNVRAFADYERENISE